MALLPLSLAAGAALADEPAVQLPEISVIGVTPVLGTGIDKDKVPADVRVIDPNSVRNAAPNSAAQMLDDTLGPVSTADYQGNSMQPSLSFRGFTVSPTLGEPQGLAVYQNGMRLNEAFGDVVNWDTNPSFAIDKVQVLPGSNPVFGLNALGGAIVLKMKDGFSNPGGSVELGGGSFDRGRATAELGRSFGDFAFYSGVRAETDGGWRQSSRSRLVQSYTDLAVRKGDLDLGMGITLASSTLAGLASSPVQLLALSRSTVFTGPDHTENGLAAVDLRGSYQLTDATALQGSLYYRHLRSATPNGNATDFSPCADNPAQLCDNTGAPLTTRDGQPVSADTPSGGVINQTTTSTDGLGASLQASHDSRLWGMANSTILGVSLDRGWTDYRVDSHLGALSSDRFVIPGPLYLGGPDYMIGLGAQNAYHGVYVTDTWSLTDHLHLTGAGRFNMASVRLHDQLGSGLDGDHYYQRFNPSVGLAWQVMPALTAYASYSEANRVPTPAELSCADPTQPCRVPNAFVADPPLRQVVSHTVEVGTRGKAQFGQSGKLDWSVAGYWSRNQDDIIFISSGPIIGSGYFANAGATERQGIDANISTTVGAWTLFADYGLVRAVFDSHLSIQSPFNTGADASGVIHVQPGDRMPGIPLHSAKLGAAYAVTADWSVGGDARLFSDRALRGDESNAMPKIPGYGLVNLWTTYNLTKQAQLLLRVQNLFDRRYATAGAVGDPTQLYPSFTDTRFETPGEPRSFWVGARMTF